MRNPKRIGTGYFGFSATRDPKVQGYPLHPDFVKRKIPKERALGHFGISATGGSRDQKMGHLTREVPVPDKRLFGLALGHSPWSRTVGAHAWHPKKPTEHS
jgi:hypothetical protein